ncbi:MAG: YegS/Rv2252/BmrU family lipid kinase [Lachnospiraceae bacterium]|nr:YegS/Rv2252/BmrU family lipid kinase [Lachnospiraceae bacterium]
MKLLFIYNPRAGKAKIRNNLLDIIDIFTKAGFIVTAHPTQAPGDARNVVSRLKANAYDLIVCSGGDGTLDEVVSGIMLKKLRIPLGYIPAGTMNDFARNLRIPSNMLVAAERICQKNLFACDIGVFNDANFVYIAAFGLFTDVSYETRQDIKNMIGNMAYILEGMRRLPDIKVSRMRVETEGIDIEDDFLFGMITNSVSVGGFKHITGKRIKLDDGLFEVTLVKKPKNPIELNNLIAALLTRNFSADCMYWFKTSHLKITAAEETAWTLDGEFGGLHIDVTIKNMEKALNIIC